MHCDQAHTFSLSLLSSQTVTDSFLSFVEAEIKSAKSAGKYDVGITSLSGRKVVFTGQHRSFTFGGAGAKNQLVNVYQIQGKMKILLHLSYYHSFTLTY